MNRAKHYCLDFVELFDAADNKRSVVWERWVMGRENKRASYSWKKTITPAAVLQNFNARFLKSILERGVYVNYKEAPCPTK